MLKLTFGRQHFTWHVTIQPNRRDDVIADSPVTRHQVTGCSDRCRHTRNTIYQMIWYFIIIIY